MHVRSQVNATDPVMVTGATGYVAGWLVERLLDEGLTVHAAVRDPGNADRLKYLDALASASPGDIRYFKADLLEEGSYDAAMQGCNVVFHVASPFSINVKDPQADLVDPALLGTRSVLGSAMRTESVRRVVLTSSCAAIFGDSADPIDAGKTAVTESDWNTTSSLTHQPYAYSKTLAEKAAWEIAGHQDRWKLVVINPSLVIGPGIDPFSMSESSKIVKQFGDGTMKGGAPPISFGVVDVRDVAEAHFRAAFIADASGRHIISAENTDMTSLARALREKFGNEYPFPRKTLPRWLLWLIAPIVTGGQVTRRFVSRNAGYPWCVDNAKSVRELGMQYRPTGASISEHFQQLIDAGLISRT